MCQTVSFLILALSACQLVPAQSTNGSLAQVQLRQSGAVFYVLDSSGVFHRDPPLEQPPWKTSMSYTVLKNGALVPKVSQYSVKYKVQHNGDLVPDESNTCVYKTDRPTSYLKAFQNVLVPVEKSRKNLLLGGKAEGELVPFGCVAHRVSPDTSCAGEVVMFQLQNNGVLARKPADPYLPQGLRTTYSLSENFVLRPKYNKGSCGLTLTYTTGQNGDLLPGPGECVMQSREGELVSFMLGDAGKIFPVKESKIEDFIKYYFDGRLVHSSRQFDAILSNSSIVLLNNQRYEINNEKALAVQDDGPRFVCREKKRIAKRSAQFLDQCLQPCAGLYQQTCQPQVTVCDERGSRIPIIPEITSNDDVILYKLTCKGNLVRFPPCKEPEYNFDVTFQLFLDTFTLTPGRPGEGFWLTYTLQENGDLKPSKKNCHSFVKAPGSLVVYMLGKNNLLFAVEQCVNKDGSVSYFFENNFICTTPKEFNDPLKFYNTRGDPIFTVVDGKTMFTSHSKRIVNARRGSTWLNPNLSHEHDKFIRDLFLLSPDNERIPVVPCKGSKGAPVVYDLDSKGVFHKSPKDHRRCISLKSYCLIEHNILLPTKDAKEYIYIVAKNGDLMPYVYPEKVLVAPYAHSLKYVLCEKGILLPIKIEIINNYICYIFNDVIVYKRRSFSTRKSNCFGSWKPDASSESDESRSKEKNCARKKKKYESDESSSEEEKPRKCTCGKIKCTCGCRKTCKEMSLQEKKEIQKLFRLFLDKSCNFVYYKKCDKMLVRHPPEKIPPYLKHTMGSFLIEEGRLKQTQFKDPDEKTLNLMLEPEGNMLEDSRNIKHPDSNYYVLGEDGSLISVDAVKKSGCIIFFKDGTKLFEVKMEQLKTPSGKDPMNLQDDPEPGEYKDEEPLLIPIPLKSMTIDDSSECDEPCAELKESLKKLLKREGADDLALNLKITNDIMDDIRCWADKRDERRCGALKKRDLLAFLEQRGLALPAG